MSNPQRPVPGTAAPWQRATVILGIVTVAAVIINYGVATLAKELGASPAFAPLTLPVFGAFPAAGIGAGWLGWRQIQRRAARPWAVLRVLVPALTVLSLAPDLLLLALRFIPGTTTTGVAALMTMHLVVATTAVTGYLIATPRQPSPGTPAPTTTGKHAHPA
jgi:Family of unknown function (DUF6069)